MGTSFTADWPSIAQLVAEIAEGRKTAVETVTTAIARVRELNPTYQAILMTLDERALERAKMIDEQIKSGKAIGKLAGVPFVAKDNYLVFGGETTAASNMLKGFVAPYQSTAIERLEAEGAICIGKSNLDAFAHGGSTENSDFFVTKNPHDLTRVAGGSSGGSAAAVALGIVPFALGTDTGGSIRQPASYCGVVGYKPTYGLVSRSGVVAMASSTDVLGPFALSVEDAAIVLECMAGPDPLDGTTIPRDDRAYTDHDKTINGKKIGVIKEYFGQGLDSGVEKVVRAAISSLERAGATIVEVSVPSLPLALAVYYIVVPAELSSNLARHDGQRYQYAAKPDTLSLEESYTQSRTRGFGAEAKRRIMIGTHVLSSGYYDAYYKKAQTVRTKLINEFNAAFEKVDFMVGPVAPTTAFKIGANEDPMHMYLQDILTVASNLVGMPAISVPCGFADGLPVGVQLLAARTKDRSLLSISAVLEKELAL